MTRIKGSAVLNLLAIWIVLLGSNVIVICLREAKALRCKHLFLTLDSGFILVHTLSGRRLHALSIISITFE